MLMFSKVHRQNQIFNTNRSAGTTTDNSIVTALYILFKIDHSLLPIHYHTPNGYVSGTWCPSGVICSGCNELVSSK